jgi:hypothetical protein
VSTLPLEGPITNTEHGLLVALGEFLRQHGLLDQMRQLPISQKTHAFEPQDKLIEFLAGIMSGIEHLQDLNLGPRPLAKDATVAQAWGLEGFANFTTVGRTLARCDAQTVAAAEAAITAFSRPFVQTTVHELLRRGQPLIYDLDLTGQAVSSTSTTYPQAAFGWMNDQVQLGYQLARVSLSPHIGERIWLAGFHHPGNMLSTDCLRELISAAEAQTGVRPRRRVELVIQRIEQQQAIVARWRRLAQQQQTRRDQLQATHVRLIGQLYHAAQIQNGPISRQKQARLRQQVTGWRKRLPTVVAQLAKAEQMLAAHQASAQVQETRLIELRAWQAQLQGDNQTNPNPPDDIEARMDSGFTAGEHVAWLLEMGYWPNTKAHNGQTASAMLARLPDQPDWQKVGENAEMVLVGEYQMHNCPYPLTAALERFKVGRDFKYATLVRYGPAPKLAEWFAHYNARQTIEAGNKEMKGIFHVQHLMSRSPAGIRLQVLFTGLAANVVRWCRAWLHDCAATLTPNLTRTLNSPKRLIRVGANSPALVQQTPDGLAVQFAPASALPGATFFLRGVRAFQLPLCFQQPFKTASDSTKRPLNAHSLGYGRQSTEIRSGGGVRQTGGVSLSAALAPVWPHSELGVSRSS